MLESGNTPMIEIRDLTKSYGPYQAVDRLSFSVKKGEVVGFLGPNGAGKTTTMKMITGFMPPTSGSVRVAGFDVFEDPIEVKKRIGYLPETPPLYGEMTVEDYLRFVARLKGVESSRVRTLVDRAVEKTDLGSVRKRTIQNLSKGYRQRIGISQALVADPEILILDEPTVGLDPRQVAEVRNLIKDLAGQHTIILSTHILPEVQATCERIIIINRGRIVAEDSLEGLGRRMSASTRVYLKVIEMKTSAMEDLKSLRGVKNVLSRGGGLFEIDTDAGSGITPKVAETIVNAGCGLLELREEQMNLEDVFLKLTTNEESQADSQTSVSTEGVAP